MGHTEKARADPHGTTCSEQSFGKIQALTTAVGAYTNSPLTVSAEQDPLVLRAGTEAQMREQVVKENELLAVVKQWQNKSKDFEFDAFGKIAQAVSTWETERCARQFRDGLRREP